MTLEFFRICTKKRAATAFDGKGASLFPGRWNLKNVPLVYCASTESLAAMEYFVHVDSDIVPELVVIRARLPDGVAIETVDPASLPKDWHAYPGPSSLQALGSAWAASNRTVALRVPSAVIRREWNVLLNPSHPDMARLQQDPPEPFAFDPRMFK